MSGPPPASSTMSGPPPAGRAVSVIAAGAGLGPPRGRRTCSPRRYAAARGRQRRRGDEPTALQGRHDRDVVWPPCWSSASSAREPRTSRSAARRVLDKIPTDADAVVVGHLDPAASQKMNLFRTASKFPDVGTGQVLTQKLDGMLDDGLSASGLTHEDLGWVGGEIG